MNFDFDTDVTVDLMKAISTKHGAVNFWLTYEQYFKLLAELQAVGATLDDLSKFTRGSKVEVLV